MTQIEFDKELQIRLDDYQQINPDKKPQYLLVNPSVLNNVQLKVGDLILVRCDTILEHEIIPY